METKNYVTLVEEKNERVYQFHMENGSPLGETYEVLCGFMDKIVALINEHNKSVKLKEETDEIEHIPEGMLSEV